MKPPPDVKGWTTSAAFFPWTHVQDSIDGLDSVVYGPAINWHQESFGAQARACPSCGMSPFELFWIAIQDPLPAWEARNGRAGVMTICDRCKMQVDFLIDEDATRVFADNFRQFGALW